MRIFGFAVVRDVCKLTSSETLKCSIRSGCNVPPDVTFIPLDVSRIRDVYRNIIRAIRRKYLFQYTTCYQMLLCFI